LLVTTASIHGMPVSTTHVSVGSIFGIGTVTRQANNKVIKEILFSWVLTLPIAAFFSAVAYLIMVNIF
ncbi:inorganic phosphate transporter, partial [Cytophagaceae bacterium AH-315-L13]|nr:inorganic phosphate transporter [Cytophagaceae bacterium AH-315-L13]